MVVFLDEVSSSGLAVVSFTEMVTGARAVTSEFFTWDYFFWNFIFKTNNLFTSSVGVGLGLGGLVVLLVVVNTVKGVVDLKRLHHDKCLIFQSLASPGGRWLSHSLLLNGRIVGTLVVVVIVVVAKE